MEGSVAQGLSAARYGENTFADECVAQSNFHDDTALHIDEMPTVTVVDVESGEVHGVVGERGGTRPLQRPARVDWRAAAKLAVDGARAVNCCCPLTVRQTAFASDPGAAKATGEALKIPGYSAVETPLTMMAVA